VKVNFLSVAAQFQKKLGFYSPGSQASIFAFLVKKHLEENEC